MGTTAYEIFLIVYMPYFLSFSDSASCAEPVRLQGEIKMKLSVLSRQNCSMKIGTGTQQRHHITAIIRVILVISTRADIAVIFSPVPLACYTNSLGISHLTRLSRLGEDAKIHLNDSPRQNCRNNAKYNTPQADYQIALITLIMVISTCAGFAINFYPVCRWHYLTPTLTPFGFRLPKPEERAMRHSNESSPKRSHQNCRK